jgi:cell division protein FtsB
MIPSYKEQVNIKVVEQHPKELLDLQQLQHEVQQLRLTVEYLTREKQRLKEQINDLGALLRKS